MQIKLDLHVANPSYHLQKVFLNEEEDVEMNEEDIKHWCLFCYYLFMTLQCKSHFNRNIHVGVPVGQS